MANNERTSILKYIANSSGYDIALMTTFNFEINYFERAILSLLTSHNVRTVSLFVDAEELTNALGEVDTCHLGRRYMVSPVRMSGSFHPKVILLLGEKKAKLIVASANIKTSGYAINNEVYGCVTYDPKHREYLDVICDAIDFFLKIDRLSYHLDSKIIDNIKELPYYRKAPYNGQLKLLHNVDTPILEQLTAVVNEDIRHIDIAVPYYDQTLSALEEIRQAFPDAEISLYIQNGTSTFPKEYNDKYNIVHDINIFDSFIDNGSDAFYHGKTFLFKGEEHSYVLYGSANCTNAALTRTPADGGNVECCFLAMGDQEEFDDFFNNLDLYEDEEELYVNDMVFESSPGNAFYFKFSRVDTGIFLYFNAPKNIRPKLAVNNLDIDYVIKEGDLIATLPDVVIAETGEIFDVTFTYDDKKESVRCWVYNPEALQSYRNRIVDVSGIDAFELDSEGNKYLQDRINLLNAEQTCLPELEEYRKQMAYYNQTRRDLEEGAGDDDDYIVDVEIPEEYNFAYRKFQKVGKIRELILRSAVSRYKFLFKEVSDDEDDPAVSDPAGVSVEPAVNETLMTRAPSSEEQKFERFMRGKVNGMKDKQYASIIEPEHLFSIVQEIMNIFSKYRYVDLFDDEFVTEARVELYKQLLTKDFSESDVAKLDYIVLLECYRALVYNYFIVAAEEDVEYRENLESINRELLMAMEKKYGIRTIYPEHIKDLFKAEDAALRPAYIRLFSNYIEKLFGYKDYDRLVGYIETMYDDVYVCVNGSRMMINAGTEHIRGELNPNYELLREVRNYSRNVEKIDSVYMTIHNRSETESPQIRRVSHEVNYRSRNWTFSAIYESGLVRTEKPEFINI